jgi:hypothetical protein
VGDSLVGEVIPAGTTIYGLFSSITITSGNAILQLAGYSRISDLVNSYYNTAAQYGYYSEAQKCTSERLNPYLAGGLYDKASWLLIPSQVEEDFVRAFKPTDNSGSLSFTRASDATRTNAAGEIERTPWNLLQQSETFDNATGWSILGTRLTFSKVTGPTGTNNAYLFTEVAATDFHNVFTVAGNRPTSEAGRTYTVSAYLKAGTRRYCGIAVGIAGSGVHVFVDTTNWTITDAKRFSTNTNWVYLSSSVQADLNGFYRVSLTFRTDAALSMSTAIFASNVSTSPAGEASYLGDGSTIISTAAQLVEGTDAKPYFPTTNRLDVPRLDYRNADGTVNSCPRLLLEPQRTNLITFSEDFEVPKASYNNASVLVNTDISPDGTLTADKVTFNGDFSAVRKNFTYLAGTTYTISFYAKRVSGVDSFTMFDSTNSVTIATFNFTNEWVRYTGTFTPAITSTLLFWVRSGLGTTSANIFLIWGAQVEAGAYPTTYIPTTTAAVTRLVDAFSRSNIYTNGLISAAGGTWFIDFSANIPYTRDTTGGGIALNTILNAITTDDGLHIRNRGIAPSRLGIYKVISGANTLLYTTLTDSVKIAIKWNGTTADVFVNGVKQVSATAFTTTAMQFINSSTIDVPKFINQSALFPAPLTDEECITITTL